MDNGLNGIDPIFWRRKAAEFEARDADSLPILKGAQIPSRRKVVLVNHAAKPIATLDSSTAPIGMSCTPRVRWRQS